MPFQSSCDQLSGGDTRSGDFTSGNWRFTKPTGTVAHVRCRSRVWRDGQTCSRIYLYIYIERVCLFALQTSEYNLLSGTGNQIPIFASLCFYGGRKIAPFHVVHPGRRWWSWAFERDVGRIDLGETYNLVCCLLSYPPLCLHRRPPEKTRRMTCIPSQSFYSSQRSVRKARFLPRPTITDR